MCKKTVTHTLVQEEGVVPSGMGRMTAGGAWDFTRASDPHYD